MVKQRFMVMMSLCVVVAAFLMVGLVLLGDVASGGRVFGQADGAAVLAGQVAAAVVSAAQTPPLPAARGVLDEDSGVRLTLRVWLETLVVLFAGAVAAVSVLVALVWEGCRRLLAPA